MFRLLKSTDWFSVVFVILVWGMTFANTRALLDDFSPLEILLLRFTLAWAVLKTIERAGEGKERAVRRIPWRDEVVFAAMGLTGIALYQFLENCAIGYTNASNVAILVSFGPILTALLARFFTQDRSLSLRFVAGTAIAIAGVVLVSVDGVVNIHLHPAGDAMAFGAMVSWAGYSVLMDFANRRDYPQVMVMRKAFFWALVLLTPFAVWGATENGAYALDGFLRVSLDARLNALRFSDVMNWLNLGFLGVLASALCFVMWNRACRSLGVVRTSVSLYLTPIVGALFAMLFLGEHVTLMGALGGTVIVAGVALAGRQCAS